MQCISKSESTILSLKWQEKLIFVKAKRYEYTYTVMVKLLHRDLRALLGIVYLSLDGEIQTNLFITPAGFKKTRTSSTFFQKNNLSNNRPPEATEPVLLILVRLN